MRKIVVARARDKAAASFKNRWEPDHTEQLSEKQLNNIVHDALELLPPRQRTVFELRRLKDYSVHEIAEQLDISKNTVEVHLTAATRTVRAYFLARLDLFVGFLSFSAILKNIFFKLGVFDIPILLLLFRIL